MRSLSVLPLLGLSAMTAGALELTMDQQNDNRQLCAGMYSRTAWGGAVEPHILIKFVPDTSGDDSDPITSMVIFEWKDYDLIGVLPTAESMTVIESLFPMQRINTDPHTKKEYICDTESIENKFCNNNQTGEFILAPNATEISKSPIYTKAIHLKDPGLPINYAVKKTGYYCVGTSAFSASDVQYKATVEFRNAYGELPAAQIAKLPFYGGITLVYAVIGV